MGSKTYTVLLNETHGSRFFQYNPGDHFRMGAVVQADDLNEVYAIGNREDSRLHRLQAWPHLLRSVSVGDVILAGNADLQDWTEAWAVANFGFDRIGNVRVQALGEALTIVDAVTYKPAEVIPTSNRPVVRDGQSSTQWQR